jgi:6-phosphogluconolactonase
MISISRRRFLSWLGGAAAAPTFARAQQTTSHSVALYASVGAELTHYDVDVEGAALIRRETVTLPAGVQYAWPHRSRRHLYVASSNTAAGVDATPGAIHHATAFRIDASGALAPHGTPIALPSRPIHITSDMPSEHVLVAFNSPSALRVYRINRDATLGDEVRQAESIDAGIYGHQVRVTSDNRMAILVTRGNAAAGGRAEDPGALKVFSYRDGQLTKEVSIAPNGGYGFGPRHLDFHPVKPWVYVSLERQNALSLLRRERDRIYPEPLFRKEMLAVPGATRSRQVAGTVHVHPNGRFVYGVNRADAATEVEGRPIFAGGENSLVVFAIHQATGEPTPIQHIDTRGIHCRTFHIDPSGRLLVAAHIMPLFVTEGATVRNVPAGLSVFRIGEDGRLEFVRKYDVEVGSQQMFWMGMVPTPA